MYERLDVSNTRLILIKQAILGWSFRQLQKISREICRLVCLVTDPPHACGSSASQNTDNICFYCVCMRVLRAEYLNIC